MKADKCNHETARIFEKTRIMYSECRDQSGHGSGPFTVETWGQPRRKIYVTFWHLAINQHVSIIIHATIPQRELGAKLQF
jgi:hypothetical protein